MTSHIADVLIPLALDTAYSYAVPEGLALKEGDVVQVPLGTREVVGVVWCLRPGAGGNFKPVTDIVAAPGAVAEIAEVSRLGRVVHAGAEGFGSGDGPEARRFRSRRNGPCRRSARRPAAPAHDADPSARPRCRGRTASSVSSATLRMRPASASASSTPLSTKELLRLCALRPERGAEEPGS